MREKVFIEIRTERKTFHIAVQTKKIIFWEKKIICLNQLCEYCEFLFESLLPWASLIIGRVHYDWIRNKWLETEHWMELVMVLPKGANWQLRATMHFGREKKNEDENYFTVRDANVEAQSIL